jgi:hypothetical protein
MSPPVLRRAWVCVPTVPRVHFQHPAQRTIAGTLNPAPTPATCATGSAA